MELRAKTTHLINSLSLSPWNLCPAILSKTFSYDLKLKGQESKVLPKVGDLFFLNPKIGFTKLFESDPIRKIYRCAD